MTQIPYYYAGEEIEGCDGKWNRKVISEKKEGLSKPLAQVIDRINLLGHIEAICEREFSRIASFNGFDPDSFSFLDLRAALPTVDVQALSPNYGSGGEDTSVGSFVGKSCRMRERNVAETYTELYEDRLNMI